MECFHDFIIFGLLQFVQRRFFLLANLFFIHALLWAAAFELPDVVPQVC